MIFVVKVACAMYETRGVNKMKSAINVTRDARMKSVTSEMKTAMEVAAK